MIANPKACLSPNALQSRFLALVPRLEGHARICFRHIPCAHQRADKVAETIALAWKWFLRLQERGKDVEQFPMVFTFLAAQAVRSGRRLCGQEPAKDVLSARAQHRHDFQVETLPSYRRPYHDLCGLVQGQRALDAYEERLHDNRVTPPPEAAAFRIDFPNFLAGLSKRDRELAMYLSLGHPGKMAGRKFQLSAGRVTQLRQQWCQEWRRFQGEAADNPERTPIPA